MLQVLDGPAVRRWCACARVDLAVARAEIDALNVFPVPDGDTGTNLLLTVEAVEREVEQAATSSGTGPEQPTLSAVSAALSRGALMGARGNSGVLLSQLLRGLAEQWAACGDGAALARGLRRGAELAYAAVSEPVEGTMLTVASDAADAAEARLLAASEVSAPLTGPPGPDVPSLLGQVLAAAVEAAQSSLLRTTALLPSLAAAGVVDAGARGWCVVLQALQRVVEPAPDTGTSAPALPYPPAHTPTYAPALLVPRARTGSTTIREAGSDDFAYEVQYLLHDSAAPALAHLRRILGRLGDCVVVVGDEALANVHVHVNDVGAAVEAGIEAGRPSRITVTRFQDQYAAAAATAAPTGVSTLAGSADAETGIRTVLALAVGAGLAALFADSGAEVVDTGSGLPSAERLVEALRRRGAVEAVFLPNDADAVSITAQAARLARESGILVAVVPTRSAPQGLAAVAVADPTRSFADDVANMAEAAGSTRWGQVLIADREAATTAGICRPGDVLGLLDGDVVLIAPGGAEAAADSSDRVEQVARQLLSRLLGSGGELVTLLSGQAAAPGLLERLSDHVAALAPHVEVAGYDGGQACPLLLGVE